MRILTISDVVAPVLYGPHIRERVGKVDLILSCGDLPYHYLEYVVSLLDAPLFFVHGNHDQPVPPADEIEPAESHRAFTWATNLHRRTVRFEGLLLAGLEGCRVYNPGAPFQYTPSEANWQAFFLAHHLRLNQLRYGRGLDVLVTHAPALGIHDAQDIAHRGFKAYRALLERFRPLLMVHGHNHVYRLAATRETDYAGTHVVNTFGYRIIELARCPDGHGWRLVDSNE